MNIRKHGIDLVDAQVVFETALFVTGAAKRPRSMAQGDEREAYSSGESKRRCASTLDMQTLRQVGQLFQPQHFALANHLADLGRIAI